MLTIGFIGLGNMGRPMAANLVKAGHAVLGYDLVDQLREAAARDGVDIAASNADAVAGADIVLTMLPHGAAVRSVYLDAGGLLASVKTGTLLVDCSTIDPGTAREVARAAEDRGFAMLDAPVSGGVAGAGAGTLTFMVGGPEAAYEQARPILEVMGKTVVHTGENGSGQAGKICNNLILGVSMIAVCEAFALADRLGLDRQKLFDVASASSGQCWSLTSYCPVPGPVPASPANRGYQPGFTAAMMLKDLRLAEAAATEAKASTPMAATAAALYQLFCNGGEEGTDFSGIMRMIGRRD